MTQESKTTKSAEEWTQKICANWKDYKGNCRGLRAKVLDLVKSVQDDAYTRGAAEMRAEWNDQ